ncbi:hypothetical protein F5Y14DRAFT_453283 [Nemania sp. NC0429]|nr:hypothetical protein F5Y14DRAFT_453283 [Nemania sp. NC0429]
MPPNKTALVDAMKVKIPNIDWYFDRRFHWPSSKFGMRLDEIFTTLHDRFNTWSMPIQDWEAFHHDVWEISTAAKTKEELMTNLEKRMKQRIEETAEVWSLVGVHCAAGRSILPDPHWAHACQFFRTKSWDYMLAFLFDFLHPDEKAKVIKILNEDFPNPALKAPGATKSSPRDQFPSHNSDWSATQRNTPDKQEELPFYGVIPPSYYAKPTTEGPAPSGSSERAAPETRQRTKSNSRSPPTSTSASANTKARKSTSKPQQPRNRVSKKRASPVRSLRSNTRQRAAEERAAEELAAEERAAEELAAEERNNVQQHNEQQNIAQQNNAQQNNAQQKNEQRKNEQRNNEQQRNAQQRNRQRPADITYANAALGRLTDSNEAHAWQRHQGSTYTISSFVHIIPDELMDCEG